jgi:hypothetical protein
VCTIGEHPLAFVPCLRRPSVISPAANTHDGHLLDTAWCRAQFSHITRPIVVRHAHSQLREAPPNAHGDSYTTDPSTVIL